MSSPSSLLCPEPRVETCPSPSSRATRTVAIIKNHALEHRFDIEHRIYEAGFEIIKERQIEFDIDTDPDTMYELFGEDYLSFAEGPVWVYVLERRRAVEVWNTLMGDADPDIARDETSNSLRALYGICKEENAVMGSPDVHTAEIQIEAIFSSSPPFPTSDLPDVSGGLRLDHHEDASYFEQDPNDRRRTSSDRSTSSGLGSGGKHSGSSASGGQKVKFRARPLPITHVAPDIVPRMSRAAALRAGLELDSSPKRYPATPESVARTFAGVPGHKRAEPIPVASTAPPVVAPRMTRAAALRLGQPVPVKSRPRQSTDALPQDVFDGVPGHKRRETIIVASTKPPAVAPRTNRSAELRGTKDVVPPVSYNFRIPSNSARPVSRTSLDLSDTVQPTTDRPASASDQVRSRTTSQPTPTKPLNASSVINKPPAAEGRSLDDSALLTVPQPKARRSSIHVPPTITPRTNKSALLRAAQMTLAASPAKSSPIKSPGKKLLAVETAKAIRA